MAQSIEYLLKGADPLVSEALDDALYGKKISAAQGEVLFGAKGFDFHMVGMVADHLRKESVGDTVTYVVNRNVNFTNVCVKQCGFCAFSRDFREEQGYMLPVTEIVRKAKEAHEMGATEVCIQAGLPPDMDGGLYESICTAIKAEIPSMHIHGFSPEEVLYGALKSDTSVREFLGRLKEAGVGTLPGTSAEILDQKMRDEISPGRITVEQWIDVIKTAHRLGIRTTSTMMFGHGETISHKAHHIKLLRDIQDETGGFTEFVPLGFHTASLRLPEIHVHLYHYMSAPYKTSSGEKPCICILGISALIAVHMLSWVQATVHVWWQTCLYAHFGGTHLVCLFCLAYNFSYWKHVSLLFSKVATECTKTTLFYTHVCKIHIPVYNICYSIANALFTEMICDHSNHVKIKTFGTK